MSKPVLEWRKRCVKRETATSIHSRWLCVNNPALAVEEITSTLRAGANALLPNRAILVKIGERGEFILSHHRIVSAAKKMAEQLVKEGRIEMPNE